MEWVVGQNSDSVDRLSLHSRWEWCCETGRDGQAASLPASARLRVLLVLRWRESRSSAQLSGDARRLDDEAAVGPLPRVEPRLSANNYDTAI